MSRDAAGAAPAWAGAVPEAFVEAGRHRRVDAQLVVHLVFHDPTETTLAADAPHLRSIGHLATWLVER
ncbi:MAG: hypothetical protein ACXV2G_06030 [Actinomycetes bacterium]